MSNSPRRRKTTVTTSLKRALTPMKSAVIVMKVRVQRERLVAIAMNPLPQVRKSLMMKILK